jgi:hypothetical protein
MTSVREYRCEVCGTVSTKPTHWFVIQCGKSDLTVIKWNTLAANYNGATPDPDYIPRWKLTLDGLASGPSISLDIQNLLTRFSAHEQFRRNSVWRSPRFSDLIARVEHSCRVCSSERTRTRDIIDWDVEVESPSPGVKHAIPRRAERVR